VKARNLIYSLTNVRTITSGRWTFQT